MDEEKKKKEKEEETPIHETTSDYSFVKERIKERPVNRKMLIRKTTNTIGLAVLFGLVACLTFILLEPVIGNWISDKEQEPSVVVLPEMEEEILPEDMVKDEEELQAASEESLPPNNIGSAISTFELQVSDYQLIYDKLYSIAKVAQKGVVTVTGTTSDVDWFNNPYESENSSSGIIVADNGLELLILAGNSAIQNASEIKVTLYNNRTFAATVKQTDNNTGLVILAVDLNEIDQITRDNLVYATLGNSNTGNSVGNVVIAVGSPLGYSDSVCYGMITSTGNAIHTIDCNYRLITTDIYGSVNASGVLINMSGQVIGIIDQEYNSPDLQNQVSAVGISELRKLIEKLSNGMEPPYIGLYITDVTTEAKQTLGVPEGAYITKVVMDSPAMVKGIRSGDVVTAVNDVIVTNVNEYISELNEYAPEDEIVITIMRSTSEGYREMDMTVVVGVL